MATCLLRRYIFKRNFEIKYSYLKNTKYEKVKLKQLKPFHIVSDTVRQNAGKIRPTIKR